MQLNFGIWVFMGFCIGSYGQQTCTKIDSCKCQSNDGIIDLSPLDSGDANNPKFKDQDDTSQLGKYSFNPCSNFNEGTNCLGVAVCQSQNQDTYTLGSQDSAVFANVNNDLELQFSGIGLQDQIKRTAHIKLTCDQNTEFAFTATGEDSANPTNYHMTLTSKHACPQKGPAPPPSGGGGGGLSVGTILCIIMVTMIPTYVLGGVVFNKVRRGAKGIEMIPQVEFWKDFPFLVKDGVLFVFTGCKGKVQGYGQMS